MAEDFDRLQDIALINLKCRLRETAHQMTALVSHRDVQRNFFRVGREDRRRVFLLREQTGRNQRKNP